MTIELHDHPERTLTPLPELEPDQLDRYLPEFKRKHPDYKTGTGCINKLTTSACITNNGRGTAGKRFRHGQTKCFRCQ